jgi:hypothetical protein
MKFHGFKLVFVRRKYISSCGIVDFLFNKEPASYPLVGRVMVPSQRDLHWRVLRQSVPVLGLDGYQARILALASGCCSRPMFQCQHTGSSFDCWHNKSPVHFNPRPWILVCLPRVCRLSLCAEVSFSACLHRLGISF